MALLNYTELELKGHKFSPVCMLLEAMKELSTLKRELKCWENMFERTHGRKPNKVRCGTLLL